MILHGEQEVTHHENTPPTVKRKGIVNGMAIHGGIEKERTAIG